MNMQKTISNNKNPFTRLSYFLMIPATLLLSGKVQAQDAPKPHEIKIGYGVGSTTEMIDGFASILSDAATGSQLTEKNKTTTGIIFASYKYTFKNHFTVGGSVNYELLNSDAYLLNQRYGTYARHFITIAAEVDYRYINKRFFTMYSGVGLGNTSQYQRYKPDNGSTKNSSDQMWNFQVTALGFHAGNNFGAFAELGFGYRGIVNAGLFAHF